MPNAPPPITVRNPLAAVGTSVVNNSTGNPVPIEKHIRFPEDPVTRERLFTPYRVALMKAQNAANEAEEDMEADEHGTVPYDNATVTERVPISVVEEMRYIPRTRVPNENAPKLACIQTPTESLQRMINSKTLEKGDKVCIQEGTKGYIHEDDILILPEMYLGTITPLVSGHRPKYTRVGFKYIVNGNYESYDAKKNCDIISIMGPVLINKGKEGGTPTRIRQRIDVLIPRTGKMTGFGVVGSVAKGGRTKKRRSNRRATRKKRRT